MDEESGNKNIRIEIHHNRKLLVYRLSGTLDVGLLAEAYQESYRCLPDQVGFDFLWDLTSITSNTITAEKLKKVPDLVRAQASRRGLNFKSAIVTPRDADYGVVRMFMVHGADLPIEMNLFRDLDQAMTWISSEPTSP